MAMVKASIKIDWKGVQVHKKTREKAYSVLIDQSKALLDKSRLQAPVRTGTLRRSSTVSVNSLPDADAVFRAAGEGKRFTGQDFRDAFTPEKCPDTDRLEIFISYNTPYAEQVHETHPTNKKFLERVFYEDYPKVLGAVMKALGKLPF